MKNNKIHTFKLKILLNELEIIELNEMYVDEFSNTYRPLFMTEVSKHTKDLPPISANTEDQKNNFKKEKEVFEVTEEEKLKIKEIYREIAKICHPDKITDNYMNSLYILAHDAYDRNDLLTLYKLCQKINLEINLDETNILLLQRIVNSKKEKQIILETSFLWLWVHAKTQDEKDSYVLQYVKELMASR